jgi:hypothetical protein
MKANLADLNAFVSVARAGGFRDGARASGLSASGLSEAVLGWRPNSASGSSETAKDKFPHVR